jgi:hypothetical protein
MNGVMLHKQFYFSLFREECVDVTDIVETVLCVNVDAKQCLPRTCHSRCTQMEEKQLALCQVDLNVRRVVGFDGHE